MSKEYILVDGVEFPVGTIVYLVGKIYPEMNKGKKITLTEEDVASIIGALRRDQGSYTHAGWEEDTYHNPLIDKLKGLADE